MDTDMRGLVEEKADRCLGTKDGNGGKISTIPSPSLHPSVSIRVIRG